MKKSEFDKLKVGDVVKVRTLAEIKNLKSYIDDDLFPSVIDDLNIERYHTIKYYQRQLGRKAVVVKLGQKGNCELVVSVDGFMMCVVRQHLKGKTK